MSVKTFLPQVHAHFVRQCVLQQLASLQQPKFRVLRLALALDILRCAFNRERQALFRPPLYLDGLGPLPARGTSGPGEGVPRHTPCFAARSAYSKLRGDVSIHEVVPRLQLHNGH